MRKISIVKKRKDGVKQHYHVNTAKRNRRKPLRQGDRLTEDEKDYIINTYGLEPNDIPAYEVIEAINDRRELSRNNMPSSNKLRKRKFTKLSEISEAIRDKQKKLNNKFDHDFTFDEAKNVWFNENVRGPTASYPLSFMQLKNKKKRRRRITK